jgi:hypothetical protein
MSKQSSSSSAVKQLHLTDDLTDNPLVEWLSANKRYILFGLLALLTLIVISYRFVSTTTLKAERDFFQAQTNFSQFQEKGVKSEEFAASIENLDQLEGIINRHPELHAKYDGLIAQGLILEQKVNKARPFAESAFQRVQKDSVDLYHDYAETSLFISAGNEQEALERTLQLKEKMDQHASVFGGTLYLFNLIRLAMLYQQLNYSSEELQAWNEIQNYTANNEALITIHQLFKEGSTSLNQYIDERKKILTP